MGLSDLELNAGPTGREEETMALGEKPALVPTVLTRKMRLGKLPGSLVQGGPVCLPHPCSWSSGRLQSRAILAGSGGRRLAQALCGKTPGTLRVKVAVSGLHKAEGTALWTQQGDHAQVDHAGHTKGSGRSSDCWPGHLGGRLQFLSCPWLALRKMCPGNTRDDDGDGDVHLR